MSRTSVNAWVTNYLADGLDGCLINLNPDDCSGIVNLANKIKRQDFGQNGAVVSVSSNSSNLIMGACLGGLPGQCAQVVVKRKH